MAGGAGRGEAFGRQSDRGGHGPAFGSEPPESRLLARWSVAMTQPQSSVSLHPVRLGDRHLTGQSWIIVAQGAVRGILGSGPDGEVLHGCACDRRILPPGGLMVFEDLDEAQACSSSRCPQSPCGRRPRRRAPNPMTTDRSRPQ